MHIFHAIAAKYTRRELIGVALMELVFICAALYLFARGSLSIANGL